MSRRQSATSSEANRAYNQELELVETFYEFHRDAFDSLTREELALLRRYYLVGKDMPENIFAYRAHVVAKDQALPSRARDALTKVRALLGISDAG